MEAFYGGAFSAQRELCLGNRSEFWLKGLEPARPLINTSRMKHICQREVKSCGLTPSSRVHTRHSAPKPLPFVIEGC